MGKGTSFSKNPVIDCRGKNLDLSAPSVMGILNITPDSFFDGGRHQDIDNILAHAGKMISEGASIIDIGAVSTRPGAVEVSLDVEWKRLEPVLRKIHDSFPDMIISVDTYRSEIAERALGMGANMINDISGGTMDANMFTTIAKNNVPYVMMHIKGTPANMQDDPHYTDLVEEIIDFFKRQLKEFESLGHQNIILDPGFGFGKSLDHNYILLNRLDEFKEPGFPLMAGFSRKSLINKLLQTQPESALNGTTVLNTIELTKGVDILRVHDVKEAVQAVSIVNKLKQLQ